MRAEPGLLPRKEGEPSRRTPGFFAAKRRRLRITMFFIAKAYRAVLGLDGQRRSFPHGHFN